MNTEALRGHAFLPDEATLLAVPPLYATEATPLAEKLLHLHYFVGACDWYVAELDTTQPGLAFGYVDLGDPANAEWGYFDLAELASIAAEHPSGLRLVVERDLDWTPVRFATLAGRFA